MAQGYWFSCRMESERKGLTKKRGNVQEVKVFGEGDWMRNGVSRDVEVI